MKKNQLIAILLLSIFVFSCNEKSKQTQLTVKVETLEPNVNISELTSDFMKWWTYYSYNISLSSDFTGLNEQSETIDKKQFLEKLITGNYIPLKIKSDNKIETYKLYQLDSIADKGIGSTIKNVSTRVYGLYEMEGTPIPQFNFIDLEGNSYTNKNTKGKTLILKTWFIHCGACVAEFPELNEFVEKYKDRNDIIFLSLALDTKSELEKFLQQKEFDYKVVPNQKEFIIKKLYLNAFPTHLVVDENGTILKVVNKASEMIAFLENGKKSTDKKLPPPSSAAPPPPPPPPPPPSK
ncbi:TlpA family protein disulfide reductase [Maribellus maritimus]|uniref:TlpA family protein disulfide reductase n=1 Tax=Maribellus maritimus TaxID=2870838 RepID=UPI001EEB018B|nr:TlpA disulfide reductase family protein [Maribellus maritimus]MCG6190318.1 TlpA family protein disulfide reductase [Maribellus maritimus]